MQPFRAEFTASLAKVTLPVLKQQATDLQTLERRAAAARDYDTAIAARAERQRVEAMIADQEKMSLLATAQSAGTEQDERIVLKLADATLDRVKLDASGALIEWSSVGASATWKLPNLPPGGYEVVLKYESGVLEGGSVLVQEKFYTLSADIQTTLKGPIEHKLGTLRIRTGDGMLRVSVKTLLKSNLMKLLAVELVPANR